MFERPFHQRIAQVLGGALLKEHGCLFGGGTVIALRFGEYRESVDIDFLLSDVTHYRSLRQMLTGTDGINALVLPGKTYLEPLREIRADQYGIRTRYDLLKEIYLSVKRQAFLVRLDDAEKNIASGKTKTVSIDDFIASV